MRQIAIIGAGQAGLQLGIGLLQHGYQVTLVSNRSAEEILNGKIMSNQGMFATALQYERDLNLNFWETECPTNTSVTFNIAGPNTHQSTIHWQGFVDKPFQAIDQRLKFSYWLQVFEEYGGHLVLQEADIELLESLAKHNELVIVAGGKGEISQLFARDDQHSIFTQPMRSLACHYVQGMVPIEDNPGIRTNVVPGIGEYFTMPGLTKNGACEMMLFEGIPDGPFDCWKDIQSPEQHIEKSLSLLKTFLPWEAERCQNIKLTDDKAALAGRYTPVIRKPVAKLPSGKVIFGIGDTVVLNDPIAGQGANNAAKSAKIYLNRILEHQKKTFDEAWMQDVFAECWEHLKWATQWSNMLLVVPPPHIIELLNAAAQTQAIANKIANGFDNPGSLVPKIIDPIQTRKLINHLRNEENIRTTHRVMETIHEPV